MKELSQYISEKLVLRKTLNKLALSPSTKEELIDIIKVEVDKNGWECDLNHIDVSQITDMSNLFSTDYYGYGLERFKGDISKWDVSNVETMKEMFMNNPEFTGDISKWDVSKVTNMSRMFSDSGFNNDISEWDVSNCTNFFAMFCRSEFDGDISKWDVFNAEDMGWMFYRNRRFNHDISRWEVKNKCDTTLMCANTFMKDEYKPTWYKQ
jgi:surface protein